MAQAINGPFPRAVSANFKFPRAGNPYFDLVTLPQLKCFYDIRGYSDGEAVAPFGNLHGPLP
jgi:hypothetical protein